MSSLVQQKMSWDIVYREMAYISNQFRPTSEEALDYRAAWINQFQGSSLEDYGYANTIKYIKEMYQKADMVFPSLQRRLEYTPAEYKKHRKEMNKKKIKYIDLIIVNFYPFQQTIKRTKNLKNIIENIDIGGPTIVRAAAKNFSEV